MFCPKCAAENVENAQFCRSCGANISLVPQALTGHLAERPDDEGGRGGRGRHKYDRGVTIERAVRSFFMGFAFVFVAFAVKTWAPAGNLWWFWLFIPAAGALADGVGTYFRLRERRQQQLAPPAFSPAPQSFAAPPRAAELPPRHTGELAQPPSVTEATTRHLATPRERTRGDA
ncbi:MAG TPA: zinc ribbon domain-containing protein [Pyrinomonadaceae bacterium]|nr:zinc ribbon domain-containing protein [Pyrinomonadaceae bacterium]